MTTTMSPSSSLLPLLKLQHQEEEGQGVTRNDMNNSTAPKNTTGAIMFQIQSGKTSTAPKNTTEAIMFQIQSGKSSFDIDNLQKEEDDVIVTHAKRIVRKKIMHSYLLNNNNRNHEVMVEVKSDNHHRYYHNNDLPKIDESEMMIGKLLGHGGFCIVYEARIKKSISRSSSIHSNKTGGSSSNNKNHESDSGNHDDNDDNKHHHHFHFLSALRKQNKMTKHHHHQNHHRYYSPLLLWRQHGNSNTSDEESITYDHDHHHDTKNDDKLQHIHHRFNNMEYPYALKRICPKLYYDANIDGQEDYYNIDIYKPPISTLINAIADLVLEAKYLSILNHPHIIQVRAITNDSPYYNYRHHGILLDKLSCMLSYQIKEWKSHDYYHQPNVVTHLLLDHDSHKEQSCFYYRLRYAYDIATAIDYLHQNNIIYRDLKSDNIGFDLMGEIKLTDFGLIKEYDPNKREDDALFYHMTGETGSPPYMDPRVFLGLPYNELCDVYSYSILLWEILQLDVPFEHYNYHMLRTKVLVNGTHGQRPKINKTKWPLVIQDLLYRGWSFDYTIRPSMKEICQILDDELHQYYHNRHNQNQYINPSHDDDILPNKVEQDTSSDIEFEL